MQRYKNIYTDESPNELVPTCQIQYNLKTKKLTEKNKIIDRIIWLILNAKKNKIIYELIEPKIRKMIKKSYADNFTK